MNAIILTNNPLVAARCADSLSVEYAAVSPMAVLVMVRDRVHLGHALLSHPLYGSIKPNENPYRSILISGSPGGALDLDSLGIIENGVYAYEKRQPKPAPLSEALQRDYQEIDYQILSNTLAQL
ncbi:MAG: GrdX family protein [Clostridiales bacterium]|nr:GrdX family protein [Clostridiales bacterium]